MTTQASVRIKFFDHVLHCNLQTDHCNYLMHGRCVLRIVRKHDKSLKRFLELKKSGNDYLKDHICKFIWEKQQR